MLTSSAVPSVTTYVSGGVSWWAIVLVGVGSIIFFLSMLVGQSPDFSGSPVVIFGVVMGLALMVFAGGKGAHRYEQLHPTTSTIAAKLGLSPVAGSSKSFRDTSGRRYDDCSANSKKIDSHHVSSTLTCISGGKPVFAPKEN